MEAFLQQLSQQLGVYIPRALGALVILIIGWFAAVTIAAIVRKVLHRTTLDNRLSRWFRGEGGVETAEVESGISRVVFYLVMLFVLVAVFQTLGITLITEPINNLLNRLFQFAPQLLGAAILMLIAWVTARVLKVVVHRVLIASKIDERITTKTGIEKEKTSFSSTVSEAVYWFVLLLFLPAILSTLELGGLLAPVGGMLEKILGFLPNIVTAALIIFVGWFLARIVQRIVASLFVAIGTDRLSEKVGIATILSSKRFSEIIGIIAYVLILVPIVIAALNTLQLEAVTVPVSRMFEMVVLALPNIFAALLILTIGFIIGRLLAGFVSKALTSIGFNALMVRVGLREEVMEPEWTPSAVVGHLTFAGIILFALIEASEQLGLRALSDLIGRLLVLAGHIILGLIIFTAGLLLANLAAKAIRATTTAYARLLANAARVAIIVLSGAMALRQMGLANEIINLAFGLILGAIAVAVAIALGLGGREIASRELNEWVQSIKSKKAAR